MKSVSGEMLIQSSFCSSMETSPFRESKYRNSITYDWVPKTETCQMFCKLSDHSQGISLNYSIRDETRTNYSGEVDAERNCSEQSTTDRTPASASTSLVYSRRKRRGKATIPSEKRTDQESPSVINSAVASEAEMDQDGFKQAEPEIEILEEALTVPVSKLACFPPLAQVGFSNGTAHTDAINDDCSSFKSGKKTWRDEAGECSSSGYIGEDISAKDFCVSILRNNGLLEAGWPSRNCDSVEEDTGLVNSNSNNQLCKVCGHSEASVRMLICDQCEEAFHKYCCNIQSKRIPVDNEWFCSSCLKQKKNIFKNKTRRRLTKINGRRKCKSFSSKSEPNLILKMLKDSEPYSSRVRIGANFQAEVPEWSVSTVSNGSPIGEPEEIDSSECMHELNAMKPCGRLSSIGNWLQCRAEGFDGSICGKWRRAPLSEAQTGDWECFRCICWDPSRADCAVPQELETTEIMKQLKYMEMLRPQLDAKRRKVEGRSGSGSENSDAAKANTT